MQQTRYQRIEGVLSRRQTDLTVCLEDVHKHHNLSAIVRSADAVGCHHVHAVWPENQKWLTNNTSGGSKNWLDTHLHKNIDDAVALMREHNPDVQILEKTGISEHALKHADQNIIIPMQGMVQSLNVSVAAALILFEAQNQRQKAGMYNRNMLSDEIKHPMYFEGYHPVIAKQCRMKKLPYPPLDENGEIIASEQFWQALKHT